MGISIIFNFGISFVISFFFSAMIYRKKIKPLLTDLHIKILGVTSWLTIFWFCYAIRMSKIFPSDDFDTITAIAIIWGFILSIALIFAFKYIKYIFNKFLD